MIRSLKIRLFPTKEQEELMWKHINCSRFIWNHMLALQKERYENGQKHLSKFEMIKLLPPLKKQEEYKWLSEVSAATLKEICNDLHFAYQRFFNKISRYPKFKSKKTAKPNFPVRSERLYFLEDTVQVEKLGKIKYKTNCKLPQGPNAEKYSNSRISLVNGKWILSFGMRRESQAQELEGRMGIDLGIKELAVVSFKGKANNFS